MCLVANFLKDKKNDVVVVTEEDGDIFELLKLRFQYSEIKPFDVIEDFLVKKTDNGYFRIFNNSEIAKNFIRELIKNEKDSVRKNHLKTYLLRV
jgi:hypothetical protein